MPPIGTISVTPRTGADACSRILADLYSQRTALEENHADTAAND